MADNELDVEDSLEDMIPDGFDPLAAAPDEDPFAASSPLVDRGNKPVDPMMSFAPTPQPKRSSGANAQKTSPLAFLNHAATGKLKIRRTAGLGISPRGIYKENGKKVGVGECGFLPMMAPEELIENIKENWGGGRYEISHLDHNGRLITSAHMELPQPPKAIDDIGDVEEDDDDEDERPEFNTGLPGMGIRSLQHPLSPMGGGFRSDDSDWPPRRRTFANTYRSDEVDELKTKLDNVNAKLEAEREALRIKLEDEKEEKRKLEQQRLQEKHEAEMKALQMQIQESLKSAQATPQLELAQVRHQHEKERLELEMKSLQRNFEEQMSRLAKEISQPKSDPLVLMLETMRAQQQQAELKWQQERAEQIRRDEKEREERRQAEEDRRRREEDERRRRDEERKQAEEDRRRQVEEDRKRREEERKERDERLREEKELQRKLEETIREETRRREERDEAWRKEERELERARLEKEAELRRQELEILRRKEEREDERRREEREEARKLEDKRREDERRREELRKDEERRRDEQLREERRTERERLEKLEEARRQEQRELEMRRMEDMQRQFQMMIDNQKSLSDAKAQMSDPTQMIRSAFSLANEIKAATDGVTPPKEEGGGITEVVKAALPGLAGLATIWMQNQERLQQAQAASPAPVTQQALPYAPPAQAVQQAAPVIQAPTAQAQPQPSQLTPEQIKHQKQLRELEDRRQKEASMMNWAVIIRGALEANKRGTLPAVAASEVRDLAVSEGATKEFELLKTTTMLNIKTLLQMALATGLVGGMNEPKLKEFLALLDTPEGLDWANKFLEAAKT